MTRVIVELSMSLDGYVTGPDVSVEEPMGRAGVSRPGLRGDASAGRDVRQYLRAGAVDQLRLHLVPLILGAGGRLFDDEPLRGLSLRPSAVTSDPQVTHLTYDVEYAPTR